MATSMVYVAELPWSPNPLCPPHIIPILEQAVLALPHSFLIPPASGELFDNREDCLKRLQGYALSAGFAVIQTSRGRAQKPRFRFQCIHHGVETRNSRNLEENVEYNKEGEIISRRRQQATATQQKACRWQVYLVWKDIGVRGSGNKGFLLGITNQAHSHPPAANPLRYKAHERALEMYNAAKRVAQAHRESFLSYSDSQRILDRTGYTLDRHTYYNIRHRPMSSISSKSDLFDGLVAALEEAEFKYSLRFEEIANSVTNVVERQLQQIFFLHPAQIHLGQRFLPDFVFLIDGTFSTNSLNLILVSIIGIDNQNHTVPVAMSFARSESKVCFDFVFKAMNEWIFKPKTLSAELPPPRVCISDQAAGLHASAPSAIPFTKTQCCDWHVAQNIKKRLAEKRYTKEEREKINDTTWDYIKSSTATEVAENKAKLYAQLNSDEIAYIERYWVPKESQFLRLHTSKYANLGCYSSQRAESFHPVLKALLNQQLSLEEATRRLGSTILSVIKKQAIAESQEGKNLPRTLDSKAFAYLVDHITKFAISKISAEWEATKVAVVDNSLLPIFITCTECELMLRYSLPCRHHLAQACLTGQPIPKSLIHPR